MARRIDAEWYVGTNYSLLDVNAIVAYAGVAAGVRVGMVVVEHPNARDVTPIETLLWIICQSLTISFPAKHATTARTRLLMLEVGTSGRVARRFGSPPAWACARLATKWLRWRNSLHGICSTARSSDARARFANVCLATERTTLGNLHQQLASRFLSNVWRLNVSPFAYPVGKVK